MTSWRDYEGIRPYGVAIDELMSLLHATTLTASRQGDSWMVQHPNFVTQILVLPPPRTENEPIQAVVEMRTELPRALLPVLEKSAEGALFNSMATLGAITFDQGHYFVGSRLTIFEREGAWNIQLPLLTSAVIGATDSLLGGIHCALGGKLPHRASASAWTSKDLEDVASQLSQVSVSNASRLELTAEFGLEAGQVSAILGDRTALWRLEADQPHPVMGGGLFCLLQMPNHYPDKSRLHEVLGELNRMEMIAADQPPHFGAWCPGRSGNNPAYVSFLPNAMHVVSGIATNFSFWAMFRAEWAWKTLKMLDAKPHRSVPQTATPVRAIAAASRPTPTPSAAAATASHVAPAQGRSRRDRVWLARGIVGYGLSDDKLDEITQQIEAQLALYPKDLPARDLEKIVRPICAMNRSILYSQMEGIVQALRRPIPGR